MVFAKINQQLINILLTFTQRELLQ